jgi:hypothetical protein
MNKPTKTQFFYVLIILSILYLILNFFESYLYLDKLIKNQISFLIIIAAGNYAWQKLGIQTCMSLPQKIILIATLFFMTDILLYLLQMDYILAIIIPFVIYLIGTKLLRKHGYLKTECKINSTNNKYTDMSSGTVKSTSANTIQTKKSLVTDLSKGILPYIVLMQMIFSIPLFIYLCGSFVFYLYVGLLSSFVLFVFLLGINILNFIGILCFRNQRTDLYSYCVVGMFSFIIFVYYALWNNL